MVFAVQATVHTTMHTSPAQLAFCRDTILAVPHVADWECMHKHKVAAARKSNIKDNKSRIPYVHQVGKPTLIEGEQHRKFGSQVCLGPHEILEVKDNGTVITTDGTVTDAHNIQNVHLHKD